MYNLGLVSISFRDKSPEEIVQYMKKAGLTHIEWGSDVHAPNGDKKRLEEIALLQKKEGIFCSSYGTYFRLGVNDINELQAYISAAKILGTDILRLWCGNKGFSEYSEKEEEFLFEQCRKAAEIAEKNEVTMCLECHNNTFTDCKEGAIKLMKSINSPYFRMYWQPNQHKSIDENKRYIRLLSSFTRHIHVFNWEADSRYPLADSISLWKEYLSYLNKDTTLLLEFMPDDNISSLSGEAESLRKIAE